MSFGNSSHISPTLPVASLCQKLSQLSDEQHADLHDVACCWVWIREQLKKHFTGEMVEKHNEMFASGWLISKKCSKLWACFWVAQCKSWVPEKGYNTRYTENHWPPNAFGCQSWAAKCIWLAIMGRQMYLASNHGSPNVFG